MSFKPEFHTDVVPFASLHKKSKRVKKKRVQKGGPSQGVPSQEYTPISENKPKQCMKATTRRLTHDLSMVVVRNDPEN